MRCTTDRSPYIEHPPGVPVRLHAAAARDWPQIDLIRHGNGGVRIPSRVGYRAGTVLEVRVRIGDSEYGYRGQVLWRRRHRQTGYELGLGFASHDAAFHARMVEQLCHIEDFRRRQRDLGRELDLEHAARIWIARHSDRFPQIGGARPLSVERREPQPVVTIN